MKATMHLHLLPKILITLIVASTATICAGADEASIFTNRPYSIDLESIAALDPKPLKVSEFKPDTDNKVQGVRIVSKGRIFPFTYEVVTFPASSDVDTRLIEMSHSLDGHDDIILKELLNSNFLGHLLHYYQRTTLNGKPHHVSSEYIFVKGDFMYHVAATNYGAMVVQRENWGEPKPDLNADREAILLIKSLRFK